MCVLYLIYINITPKQCEKDDTVIVALLPWQIEFLVMSEKIVNCPVSTEPMFSLKKLKSGKEKILEYGSNTVLGCTLKEYNIIFPLL